MNRGRVFALAIIAAVSLVGYSAYRHGLQNPPRATWTGSQWACPVGRSLVANEQEAIAGKDAAYCVR